MPRGILVVYTRDVKCDIWIISGDVTKCWNSLYVNPDQVKYESGTSIKENPLST